MLMCKYEGMNKAYLSKSSFRILLAVILISILALCAVIKILYPPLALRELYLGVGLFEFLLAAGLLFFWNRWEIWALMALVFATWAGYSLYSTIFGLPCSCLGSALAIPRGLTLMINALIIGGAWFVLIGFKPFQKKIRLIIILSCILLIIGFTSAYIIYKVI